MSQNINIKILASDKTGKAFSGIRKKFARLGGIAKKAGMAIGAAFAVAGAGLIALTASSMKSIDALAKTADKIGITTEALAGLQFAAEQTGVSQETMSMALQRFTRRVSEAAIGTGEAKGALKELGINAAVLTRLPLDKQMGIIADSMRGLGTQADRVRVAMKLFDSEGVALVNTLAGGSAGLEAMAREADLLGIAISRQDAARIEMANDALNKASKLFEALGIQLAIAFGPLLTAITNDLSGTGKASEEFGDTGQRVADALVNSFAYLRDMFHSLYVGGKVLQLGIYKMGDGFLWLAQKVVGLLSPLDSLFDAYNAVAKMFGKDIVKKPSEYLGQIADAFGEHVGDLSATVQELLMQPMPSEAIFAYRDAAILASDEATAAIIANQEKIAKETAFYQEIQVTAQRKLQEVTVTAVRKTSAKENDTRLENAARRKDDLEGGLASLARVNKKAFAIQKAYNIGQAIMNTYTGATKALAELPPPFSYAAAALIVAGGMANVAQIQAQSFEGGGFTGFGVRAGGVDGKGGMPAIVHPNETIIDHTLDDGQGQGMGATVNFNIQAHDASGFDQLLNSRRGDIMAMIDDVLNDQGREFA